MKQVKTIQPNALQPFTGLASALRNVSMIHSYTMDMGFALGLLEQYKQRKKKHLKFCVDGCGYRPTQLSKAEWNDIVKSSHFSLIPKYHKGGVFHSKAWFCEQGLLLGSANLSIREARENLNFWCWMPGTIWKTYSCRLDEGESLTIIIPLNGKNSTLASSPLKALEHTLKGKQMTNMVIVSPERPSREIFKKLAPYMAAQGNCCIFLKTDSYAIKSLPIRREWEVRNFIPRDRSIGLHGKAMYGEWGLDRQQGAILYVGSANFTQQGYTGGNLESGVLLKAEGTAQVKKLQNALSSLLGNAVTKSQAQKAWATERFDGCWKRVEPSKDLDDKKDQFHNQDDIDLSIFINGLKAKSNELSFPAKYGTKEIIQAELSGYGDYPQIWKKTAKHRQFSGVFWSPALKLKLRLKGGRIKPIDVPPLEGLMSDDDEHIGLLELLLDEPEPLEGSSSKKIKSKFTDTDISIFAGQRVLFPWRAILSNKHGHLLTNKRELNRTVRNIKLLLQNSLGEGDQVKTLKRRLEILEFTLNRLLESI